MGTFGLSVYSGLGAESLHPLSPLTTTLNYGVISARGAVTVRVTYDHRVMDGTTVARALARLETVLNEDLCKELRGT
jgi:pyruvate/2-oxoglutarate dehydrogenase complex dihydrolipoamide acyltransferase (E2) component